MTTNDSNIRQSTPRLPRILVLVGPTGVGKTRVSLEIARRLPVEIISADSRQIYRYMDIGTDKPPVEVRRKIPHHFIDILNPDQEYSAGQFARDARKVVLQILSRNRVPLVVGGSGLYIRALLEGFLGKDYRDDQLRQQLLQRVQEEGEEALYRELQRRDPETAAGIHPHNVKRVLRALEITYLAGRPASEVRRTQKDPAPFVGVKFGLTMERQALYEQINARVEWMFDQGLVEEVRRLLAMGYSPKLNALNTVGYKEVIDFLEEKIDLYTCVERVKQNTRRYAKRQYTWFRAEPDIRWFTLEHPADVSSVARKIVDLYLQEVDAEFRERMVKTEEHL
ncbi:MAG: tRNA (adenosine(37)-N6)-dimethylallyltransferase MiaA [Calditrichaeota bacterium]|nr:tRNA (adenosine(37)-N6)-dimethylallyltransferase MiaA [Calditrichota bacterium]